MSPPTKRLLHLPMDSQAGGIEGLEVLDASELLKPNVDLATLHFSFHPLSVQCSVAEDDMICLPKIGFSSYVYARTFHSTIWSPLIHLYQQHIHQSTATDNAEQPKRVTHLNSWSMPGQYCQEPNCPTTYVTCQCNVTTWMRFGILSLHLIQF